MDKTLSGLGLCPFTKSMRLSALGLENAGVQPGPVKIRHSALIENLSKETAPSVAMAALYWGGVSDIIDRPEEVRRAVERSDDLLIVICDNTSLRSSDFVLAGGGHFPPRLPINLQRLQDVFPRLR